MSHPPGALILESEEKEPTTGRSQNVVQILPQTTDSVPRFLTGPLERVDPVAGGTQLVVITPDSESAVALAQTVLSITGLGGIELFPVTSARRAGRLMQGRPVLAIAGTPLDLADLIRGSHLKLQDARTIVLAWADDLFEGDSEATAALELVMTELPKDSARVVVTDAADKRVDAFVERYLRRARRMDEQNVAEDAEPVSLQYVSISSASRLAGLRRLLDDVDPPSAAIVVESDEAESQVSEMLRTLGYPVEGQVRVTRGEIAPQTHAVIFYEIPSGRPALVSAAAANPVTTVAMIQPRELDRLRRMAGGDVRPLTLRDAGRSARDRERNLRRELTGVLESGVPAREILALEPLLDSYDGIEIAAAALRLLEKERSIRKSIETAAAAAAPPRPRDAGAAPFERGGRPPSDRGGPPRGDARGGRGSSDSRGGRGSGGFGRDGGTRPDARDRGPRGGGDRPFRDSGPPVRRGGRPPSQRGERPSGPRPDRDNRPPRDRS